MTPQTKEILLKTISFYKDFSPKEKQEKIDFIKNKLKEHNQAIENIGLGYAEHFVSGAEIFLRIYKKL